VNEAATWRLMAAGMAAFFVMAGFLSVSILRI
jgi:hypothetical protein